MKRTTGTLCEDQYIYIYIYMIASRSILHRIRNVSKKVVEKIKTHSLLISFFLEIVPFMR
jgi:transcription initiation factor IIE alpha subunit